MRPIPTGINAPANLNQRMVLDSSLGLVQPHLGQDSASVETLVPQSLHLINTLLSSPHPQINPEQ